MKLYAAWSTPKKETIDYLNALFLSRFIAKFAIGSFLFCNKLFAIFQHNRRATAIKTRERHRG
jgi:hypothetical protein